MASKTRLNPIFHYFGSKWRAVPHYEPPRYGTIIEPFAGSACYALYYPDRQVILVEKDPNVVKVWNWLFRVSPEEMRALPDIELDQTIHDLDVCEEARLFIGMWLGADGKVHDKPTSWMIRNRLAPNGRAFKRGNGLLAWSQKVKDRTADALPHIRHWQVIGGDYTLAPDTEATWFIDPPYQVAGKAYNHGSRGLDYEALGDWCRSRSGQVMVCENDGAAWLPFRHFRDIQALPSRAGARVSKEAIWTNDMEDSDV